MINSQPWTLWYSEYLNPEIVNKKYDPKSTSWEIQFSEYLRKKSNERKNSSHIQKNFLKR